MLSRMYTIYNLIIKQHNDFGAAQKNKNENETKKKWLFVCLKESAVSRFVLLSYSLHLLRSLSRFRRNALKKINII